MPSKSKSIRLKGFDYGWDGYYFITICAYRRRKIFGRVKNGKIELTNLGKIVTTNLHAIPEHFHFAAIGEHVIIPNHLHAILVLERSGTIYRAATEEGFGKPVAGSVATIIRTYKAAVTRAWRRKSGNPEQIVWQRRYHDRVIRNEKELETIRRYMRNNPLKWELDRYYPHQR